MHNTPQSQLTPTRKHRISQPIWVWVALYVIGSLLGVWLQAVPFSSDITNQRVFTGFDGVEVTPDGQTVFRWAGAQSTLSGPATRSGWTIVDVYAAAATPFAQLRLTSQDTLLTSFAMQSGAFRHYRALSWLPPTGGDVRRYTFSVAPVTQSGGRDVGVALAQLTIRSAALGIPARPPITWLVAIVLSGFLLGSVGQRACWSHLRSAISVIAVLSPWIVVLTHLLPLQLALLAAGGCVLLATIGVTALRRELPRLAALERRLRHTWPARSAFHQMVLWILLGIFALIIIRVWPAYVLLGSWGMVGFFAILIVYPMVLWIRARNVTIPHWVAIAGAAAATLGVMVVYWRIYQRQLDGSMMSDLPFHMDDARRLILGKGLVRYTVWVDGQAEVTTRYGNRWVSIPHPLFHWSIGAIAWFMGDTYYHRALPVTLMLYQLASMVILALVMQRMAGARVHWAWIWLTSLLLCVVAAVYLPDVNPFIYRGQGSVTVFHNATTIVAKPVTWAALLLAFALLRPQSRKRLWLLVPLAVLAMIAATLAKPNGPLAIVTALWVVLAVLWLRRDRIPLHAGWLIGPTVVAVVVLVLQSTVRSNGGSDFAISWMAAAALSSPEPILSVLQLVAFPLLTILLTPVIWRDRLSLGILLAFVIAVLQYFVFVEPANISANNFAWGMRIIVPLLFACTLGVLFRERHTGLRLHLLALVLTAHLLAGVLYLIQLLTTSSYL